MSMSVERSFEHLVRANPVPNPAALRREMQGREGAAAATWRMDMSNMTVDSESRVSVPKKRRWAPAVAVAALALLVGVPLVAYLTDNLPVGSVTPVEIAERYIAARDAHDGAAMRGLLADNVIITDPNPPYGLDELELLAEMEEIQGFSFTDPVCEPFSPATLDGWVKCTYTFHSRHERAIGLPPSQGEILFITRDERITVLSHTGSSQFSFEAWFPFGTFLAEQGVLGEIYGTDGKGPLLTREALDLHAHYLDLYEQQTGQ